VTHCASFYQAVTVRGMRQLVDNQVTVNTCLWLCARFLTHGCLCFSVCRTLNSQRINRTCIFISHFCKEPKERVQHWPNAIATSSSWTSKQIRQLIEVAFERNPTQGERKGQERRRIFPIGSPLINAVEEEVYSIESSYWKFACAKNALLWT